MTTRYCGPGGNDGNSGLTWILRKLTLNGIEDTPVVAGDVCYIAPGVYRELLTVDVSGGAGTEITYIGDVTGEHTDGVGGIVRITGSDNDQAAARANCITAASKDYRIFRGFAIDITSAQTINSTLGSTHWTIEDCSFQGIANFRYISIDGASTNWIINRCMFLPNLGPHIYLNNAAALDNADHVIKNCMMVGSRDSLIHIRAIGDMTVRNCLMMGGASDGVRVVIAPNNGHPVIVENCILAGMAFGVRATGVADMTEDYNTFYANATDRSNVNVGGNSVAYPPLHLLPILHAGASQVSGFKFPWWFGELSEWSQVRAIMGSNEPSVDLRGIARPVTASKNSWGPLQFMDMERETGTVQAGSVSMVLHDAGRHQIRVPVANESTTISVYVYREANYAGNNPQMIIKQPGQADDITTDAAAASQWNLLTTTLTPAADPPYVVVELVSRNTAAAGNYKCFFDTLVVS